MTRGKDRWAGSLHGRLRAGNVRLVVSGRSQVRLVDANPFENKLKKN